MASGNMASGIEWSLPAVHDVLAEAVPDREMVVWSSTRRTFADAAARSRGFASHLVRQGVGLRRERDELDRWECGQDPVALVLRNCPEYLETMLGCYRARAVPFNVNHHYKPAEMRAIFDMIGPRAVVYHRSLGPVVDEALADSETLSRRRRRRIRRHPPPGQRGLRDGRRERRVDTATPHVAGRPLHGVHRRYHGTAESRALAPGRHLRRRDGRK